MSDRLSGFAPPENPAFDRVVIAGGGLAGLSAAAALQPHARLVEVVDLDSAPTTSEPREHLGQSWQIHNLTELAQRNLNALMPNYLARLDQLGSGSARVAGDLILNAAGIPMPREGVDFEFAWTAARRMTMERAAHLELEAAGNVIFHGRTRALGLLTERRAVTGVAVKDEANGQQRNMSADLVVDAMGASSLVPRWLRAQRLPAPSTTREPLGRWFASLVVERPEKDFQGNSFWLTLAVGDQTKGGVVTPVDSDHWQISVSGFEDDHRPRTFAQVKEHARSLDDGGTITDVLDLVDTPLDQEIHPAYRLGVLTVADDAQISLPRGLVRIGDAVRRLDPIWGQGMAIASGEARILGALVARHGDNLEAIGAANAQAATALAAKAREASDLITDATSEDPQATAEGVAASPETYKYFMEQLHMTDVEPLQLIAT